MSSKSSNGCMRVPWGFFDPYNLFFYTYSIGNEDVDSIILMHEMAGHGVLGIDSCVSLSILGGGGKEYIDSMRVVLEAISYDHSMQRIEKVDPSLSDAFKNKPDFQEIQDISRSVANIIDLIQQNTGITFPSQEIYHIILNYWQVPILSKIIKKNRRKIIPSKSIEEIKKITRKLKKGMTDKEISFQLRKALLKKKYKFLGCVDSSFDLLPFGPEVIMCFELFYEKSKERKRAIIAHLLNALTLSASRGIYLPKEALKWEHVYELVWGDKYDEKIKAPFDVFIPPLLPYLHIRDEDLPPLQEMNLGFNYHLAKIGLSLKNLKKGSQDVIVGKMVDLIRASIIVHEACNLMIAYLLIFSVSPFWPEEMTLTLTSKADPHKQVIYPYSASIKLTVTEEFCKAVDSLDLAMRDRLNEIMRFFFISQQQMQDINQKLHKEVFKIKRLHDGDTVGTNIESMGIRPIDFKKILMIEGCYKKVFEKKGDFVDFILNFPARWKEFNEIAHHAANEYFCPEDILHGYMLEAISGLQNLESKIAFYKILRELVKDYPEVLKAFLNLQRE